MIMCEVDNEGGDHDLYVANFEDDETALPITKTMDGRTKSPKCLVGGTPLNTRWSPDTGSPRDWRRPRRTLGQSSGAEPASSHSDLFVIPPPGHEDYAPQPPDPFPIERRGVVHAKEKLFAKSTSHCLLHTPYNRYWEGCNAKARSSPRYRRAFQKKDKKKYAITMDQLTVAEMDLPLGAGGFKYAIIFHCIDTNCC